MAIWYVNSNAAGANNGTTKADAFLTIEAAVAAGASGDTYFVSHTHAQTQATAQTITFKGSVALPDRCLSVNFAGSTPPVAADLLAGATITTTGTSALTIAGGFYFYGLTFNCGTSTGASTLNIQNGVAACMYDTCAFNLLNTGAASRIIMGGNGTADCSNCTVSFGAVGQGITINGGGLGFKNKSGSAFITGATIPSVLIATASTGGQTMSFDGLDLSNLDTAIAVAASRPGRTRLRNCKLHASVAVGSVPSVRGFVTELVGCHSSGNAARSERHAYEGVLTTETTIVRTGGATDSVTPYSWKMVSTANNTHDAPMETFEGAIWNSTTGSAKTLTIHTITDNVTLTDEECWLEVQYLSSSGSPIATIASDDIATVLTTPASQATSAETWTTTGLGTPIKQKLEVTFTPQMAGPVRWRVKMAKASTTVYVCPEPTLT